MHAVRLVAIMLTALSMAMSFSHLLQLPPRMSFDGPTWITTQRVFPLYASVGAPIEISAVVAAAVLAFLVRGTPGFRWAWAGSILLALALIVWLAFVGPANVQISQMAPDAMPDDWMRWRRQWEYAHAVRAVLSILGLGGLVQSVLTDVARTGPRRSLVVES